MVGHRHAGLLGYLGLERCHAQHATETTRHHEPMCKLTATHLQLYEARMDHRSTQLAHHRFSQQKAGPTLAWPYCNTNIKKQQTRGHRFPQHKAKPIQKWPHCTTNFKNGKIHGHRFPQEKTKANLTMPDYHKLEGMVCKHHIHYMQC